MRRIMARFNRPAAILPVLLVLGFAGAAGSAAAQDPPRYHTYAEMTAALQSLAGAHKTMARISSIGKTRGGRDIWAVEIANPAGVPPAKRPALLVAANFEGDHLIGSEIALSVVAFLLNNYPVNAEVKDRLDKSTIYVIPRVNPDGAEGYFAPIKTGRRTNTSPRDDDNDGRTDEDGPEDLNNDGFITMMRAKSAGGEYMIDPDEPRLMKKADPKKGETGAYKLFWEGKDNDGDGFINEDPPGGTDINRNFTHEYPYYKAEAGPHMISEAESRAVMDWIIGHRNVAAILTFGESDNLIVPPTSSGRLGPARELDLVRFADASAAGASTVGMIQAGGGFGRRGRFAMGEFSIEMLMGGGGQSARQGQAAASGRMQRPAPPPATTVNSADYDYFKTASDKYVEMTGIRQPLLVREPQGAFFQYGYFQFGVPSFSTPGFGLLTAESPGQRRMGVAPPGAGAAGQQGQGGQTGRQESRTDGAPGVDRQILRWMDAEKVDGYVGWTKTNHPDLGEVEIGGFKPYAAMNPPAAKIAELGSTHGKFALYLAALFPRVKVARIEAVNHGGGLFRVMAEVENNGFWPTSLAHGQTARAVKPTMVQLGVDPKTILSGSAKTNFLPALAGSGARAKYEWLIQGKAGQVVELVVQSEKGGTDTAKLTLK
ncbi:MAG: M14 family metallopeptidase [Candidatus Aminicenantes bacterium]|nr:M14 family metallopeptidase [Candidatus Aminicenantes bacterium]